MSIFHKFTYEGDPSGVKYRFSDPFLGESGSTGFGIGPGIL